MSDSVELVPTQRLTLGMYISKLDRPWLETPFLFQGFTIKSAEEITELRKYCDHVYVSVKDTVTRNGRASPTFRGRKTGVFQRVAGWFVKEPEVPDDPKPGDFYKDDVNVKTELAQAKSIYQETSAVVTGMMEGVREGGKLNVEVLESVVTPMMESVLRNRDAMTWLTRMRQVDDYTYEHSVSCAIYAIAFGRHLGLPKQDLEVLGLGGLLLDVGKTRVPQALLTKAGKLTEEERVEMHRHVEYGEEILKDTGTVDPRILSMIRSHHERYDGSGYPDKLKGPEIPVFARLAGIVDFYNALVNRRSYKKPLTGFDAMRELNMRSNTEFQSEMVEQFIQAVGVFPNGTLVELSTGEVGIIMEQNHVRRLRPKLTLILDRDKKPLGEPKALDLRESPEEPGEKDAVWIDRSLDIGAYGIDPNDYYL